MLRPYIGHSGAHDEDVPAAVVQRRDERDARAVGRPARLEVYGAIGGERRDGPGRQIEQLQLDPVMGIAREDDRPAIGRPIGLVVVYRTCGELRGDRRSNALPPERALHRVDQLGAVR